jgi:type VI secretion system protein ImpG
MPRQNKLESQPIDGEPCHYRTCYPVTVWPIEVAEASLSQPADAPVGAQAVLSIRLKCFAAAMTFAKLRLERLRFFLNGQPQHVLALYELIFNHLLKVTVCNPGAKSPAIALDRECILPVGFDEDQAMLPTSARSLPGYRLLTEYFAFREKFWFFDLTGLGRDGRAGLGHEIDICLHLDRSSAELEHNVTQDTFRLGCTPVINLFNQRADPIRFSGEQTEYRVVPDQRRDPEACEIYSIESVIAGARDGAKVTYQPFYSLRHPTATDSPEWFWFASRKPSTRYDHEVTSGTEVYLSLVDLGLRRQAPTDWVGEVETLCLNRDLPEQWRERRERPVFRLNEGGPLAISCLKQPTPTRRLPAGEGVLWRLISHLSLNHLSLIGGAEGADALREILRLYDYDGSPQTQSEIAGISKVSSRRVVGRVKGDPEGGVCRGILVEIEFDEARYPNNSLFLFASILERFLGLYCEVNSFTQLAITSKGTERTLRTWPPRITGREIL